MSNQKKFETINNAPKDSEPDYRQRLRSRKRKKTRKQRWILWGLGLTLVILYFLPAIVGATSLKNSIVKQSLGNFSGTVEIQSMSLGWFSPIRIENMKALDSSGQPLLEVASVTTSKRLFRFLFDNNYGEFNINSPVAYVSLRPDGSNLEDAIAEITASPGGTNAEPNQPPSALPRMTVNIVDGRAVVASTVSRETWNVEGLGGVAEIGSGKGPLELSTACSFVENGAVYGTLGLGVSVDPGDKFLTGGNIQFKFNSQNLPLALGAPVAARFLGPVSMDGLMTGDALIFIDARTGTLSADIAQLRATDLQVRASRLTGNDQIMAANVSASGKLDVSPKQISSSNFVVGSELGNVTANGTFDLNQISGLVSEGQLVTTPLELDGRIDLARVINMLPETLGLYHDLNIASGEVTFHAASGTTNGIAAGGLVAGRMVISVEATNIKASRGGQQIAWSRPMRLAATVYESSGQMAVENLSCESEFLNVTGNGSLGSGAFTANGDLAKLAEKLGQFTDLGGLEMAGVLDGEFGWTVIGPDGQSVKAGSLEAIQNAPIEFSGDFSIEQPLIRWPEMQAWQPGRINGVVQASGRSLLNGGVQIATGGTRIDIGSEQVVAMLAAPVESLGQAGPWPWPLDCQMTGSLENWLAHAQNFVDLGEFRAAGNMGLECGAVVKNGGVQLSNISYAVEQLEFDGYSMNIREPRIDGTTHAHFDFQTGRLLLQEFTLSGSSLAASGSEVSILAGETMLIDGLIAFRADMNRVADWWQLQESADAIRWYGAAEGQVQLISDAQGIGGQVQALVKDFVAAGPPANGQIGMAGIDGDASNNPMQLTGNATRLTELWREETVNIGSTWKLAGDFDSIEFDSLQVDSRGIKVDMRGGIEDFSGSMNANLDGTWNPDWQQINGLLDSYTYQTVQLAGQGPYPLAIQGPLWAATGSPETGWVPSSLSAQTSFTWDSGTVIGLPLGSGQVDLDLVSGIAEVKTNPIAFADGQIGMSPKIDLRTEHPVMTLEQSTVATQIALTEETCRRWLKYVTPFAADATAARGKFTVMTDGVSIPVMDPTKMHARGSVRLEDVSIGAGPATEQLLGVAMQIRSLLKPGAGNDASEHLTWLKLQQQDVPFAVQDGRVYHDGMRLKHRDVTIQTRGSVGFDQTLSMMAEIPIHDSWIGDNRYLAGLKGQSISIPVGGTVSRPQLDRSALKKLTTDIARLAADSAINGLVEEKLAPEVTGFQNKVNDRVSGELNDLQNKFQEEIGGALLDGLGGGLIPVAPANSIGEATGGAGQQIGDRLEDGLKSGLDNLFNFDRE